MQGRKERHHSESSSQPPNNLQQAILTAEPIQRRVTIKYRHFKIIYWQHYLVYYADPSGRAV
jgi:hypothetical protein